MKLLVLGGNALKFLRRNEAREILRSPRFSTGEMQTFSADPVTQSELVPVNALGQKKAFEVRIESNAEPFVTKYRMHEDLETVALAEVRSDDNETMILELWPAGSLNPLLDSDMRLDVFGMTLSGDVFVILSWEMMQRVHTELMSLEVDVLQ